MTDIVERLREGAAHVAELDSIGEQMPNGLVQVLNDAAEEIERLRAQVVSLQSSLDAGPEHTRLGKKKTPDALEPKP